MRVRILVKLDWVSKMDTIYLSQVNAPIYVKQPLKQQKLLEIYHMHPPVSHFY